MKKTMILTTLSVLAGTMVSAQPRGAAKVMEHDPNGVTMTLVCVGVVFSALVVLYVLFTLVGKYMSGLAHRKDAQSKGKNTTILKATKEAGNMYSGEEVAAIAAALQLYMNDLHDLESNVITINKVARVYSPWSSKIYGLRQIPDKNCR